MRQQSPNSEFHLNRGEIRRLIDAAKSPRDLAILQLFAFTGIRRAELRDLRWYDIELPRRRLIVRRGKGGKQRIVFLSQEPVAAILNYRKELRSLHGPEEHTDLLFPGRDRGPMSLRNINLIVARVGRMSGIENPNPRYRNISPHLLRHSFARNWKRAGGSMESLQKLLGHSSLRTTMDVYGTESLDETEQNFRALQGQLVAS